MPTGRETYGLTLLYTAIQSQCQNHLIAGHMSWIVCWALPSASHWGQSTVRVRGSDAKRRRCVGEIHLVTIAGDSCGSDSKDANGVRKRLEVLNALAPDSFHTSHSSVSHRSYTSCHWSRVNSPKNLTNQHYIWCVWLQRLHDFRTAQYSSRSLFRLDELHETRCTDYRSRVSPLTSVQTSQRSRHTKQKLNVLDKKFSVVK